MTDIPQRRATHPAQILTMSTRDLRDHYLVTDLFVPGELRLVYSHEDRIVLGGAVPDGSILELTGGPQVGGPVFLEHREVGIVNIGSAGSVTADGETYRMERGSCLYLGRGVEHVTFADEPEAVGAGRDAGPQFYLFSAVATSTHPNALVSPGDATVRELGDDLTSNRRTLRQFIHGEGVRSSQIVMGVTELHPGSTWNTMPAHTHDRRTECYLYFDVPHDARVIHLMGEPDETRHLVVADRQAVISPSWSLHSGVGTASYSFVWAMAGENQAFGDIDPVPVAELQ